MSVGDIVQCQRVRTAIKLESLYSMSVGEFVQRIVR